MGIRLVYNWRDIKSSVKLIRPNVVVRSIKRYVLLLVLLQTWFTEQPNGRQHYLKPSPRTWFRLGLHYSHRQRYCRIVTVTIGSMVGARKSSNRRLFQLSNKFCLYSSPKLQHFYNHIYEIDQNNDETAISRKFLFQDCMTSYYSIEPTVVDSPEIHSNDKQPTWPILCCITIQIFKVGYKSK